MKDFEFINPEPKDFIKKKNKIKEKFRQQNGYVKDHVCGECSHCVRRKYNKTYYKCELFMTNSSATDIRLKDAACRLFVKDET